MDKIGAVRLIALNHFFERNIIFSYPAYNLPRAKRTTFLSTNINCRNNVHDFIILRNLRVVFRHKCPIFRGEIVPRKNYRARWMPKIYCYKLLMTKCMQHRTQ